MIKYIFTFFILITATSASDNALVFQSDFGKTDGAVSAMHGVAFSVSDEIHIFDLSHEIPPYDIWMGALILNQTAAYWPKGTVFVSVVDPGVGTKRKSVVLKTRSGHFFVTPDNGTLTFVAEQLGIEAIREIDEATNRRKQSYQSHTFHGRDVYAYTGARLASGTITFEQVGKEQQEIVKLPYRRASRDKRTNIINGSIFRLDGRYGNVWTNIPQQLLNEIQPKYGDIFKLQLFQNKTLKWEAEIPYCETFGSVEEGKPLLYINSLMNLAIALNMDSLAEKHQISYGSGWTVEIQKK